ncbi:MAG: hypothetical protein PF487_08485 [Bacteroidales bacterium]|jgi:hypothetical protein|nr:hypothetical protein [Bacteroidales bacterium]
MKIKSLLVAIAFLFIASANSFAQSSDHKSTLSLNTGFSLIGNLLNVGGDDNSTYSLPAFQANYDYSLVDWFSIGGAASIQLMGIDYTNYGTSGEDFKTSITRTNFAVRGLFHYGNSEVLDMYSGIRFGVTNWSVSTDSDNPDYQAEDDISFSSGINVAPQVILFGIRGYFNESFGANMEIAAGSPHYLSLGINYRF